MNVLLSIINYGVRGASFVGTLEDDKVKGLYSNDMSSLCYS